MSFQHLGEGLCEILGEESLSTTNLLGRSLGEHGIRGNLGGLMSMTFIQRRF